MVDKAKITRAIVDRRRKKPSFEIQVSPSITVQYFRDINRLVRKMSQLVKERIIPILEKYSYRIGGINSGGAINDDLFGVELLTAYQGIQDEFDTLNAFAKQIATNRLLQANQDNRRRFISAWKKTVGVDVSPLLSEPVKLYGKLIDKESISTLNRYIGINVDLITTVPKQHLSKIQQAIEKGIASGDDNYSLKNLIDEIKGVDKSTRNRAKIIARDQLQKMNGVLVQARQQALGINGYVWRTSNDERVRESHRDNDGKTFQWNSPPPTGHPGEDIMCRCTAEPDLSQILPSYAESLKVQGPKRRNRISI